MNSVYHATHCGATFILVVDAHYLLIIVLPGHVLTNLRQIHADTLIRHAWPWFTVLGNSMLEIINDNSNDEHRTKTTT